MSEEQENKPDVSVGVKQVGSTITVFNPAYRGGNLEGPDRNHYQLYETAFRREGIINRALKYVALTMLASMGEYTHPNRQIQKFVQENLNQADGNLRSWMEDLILSALVYGRGNSEILWEPRDGKIYLKDIANYHPRSIHLVTDHYGRLTDGKNNPYHQFFTKTGIWQEIPFDITMRQGGIRLGRDRITNYIRIPKDKMVIVTHNSMFGNLDGESALAPIWTYYQMKTKTYADLMITSERYGAPQIAAIVPNGLTSNQVIDPMTQAPRLETIAEAAARSLENMSVSTALVFEEPSGMQGEKIRIQPLHTGNNFGDSFLSTIHDLTTEILIGLGIPPLLFLQTKGGLGSGNISAVQADTYKQTLMALYKEFVEPFTEQVIGKLIKYNFGTQETNPGRFEFNPYDIAATEILANILDTAINGGILDTSEETDLQICRTRLGLPAINDDSLDRRLKKNAELMEARRKPEEAKAAGQVQIADKQMENQLAVQEKQLEFDRESREMDLEVQKQEKQLDLQHQKETEKLKAETAVKVAKAKPKPKPPAK